MSGGSGPGTNPDSYDTISWASPTAAVAGIASGFLIIVPTVSGESVALNSSLIKSIAQK